MDEKVKVSIDYLGKVKTQCTYGVVAEMLGTNSQSVALRCLA